MKPDLALADNEELLLSGLIDSLGAMRLIAHLETLYGIKVPPEDVLIEHFETIDAMAQYLAQRGVN
jgi:acyl carrier protein